MKRLNSYPQNYFKGQDFHKISTGCYGEKKKKEQLKTEKSFLEYKDNFQNKDNLIEVPDNKIYIAEDFNQSPRR